MNNEPKPSIGRIVHWYKNNGDCLPAIIVRVLNEEMIDIYVFDNNPQGKSGLVQNVYKDTFQQGHQIESWHWPERVE